MNRFYKNIKEKMEIFEEYQIVGKKLHITITYDKLNQLVPWLNL